MQKKINIVAVTNGFWYRFGSFQKEFPKEHLMLVFEQHAVTFAAGITARGLKPYAAIYSTFPRAYDQVVHDVAIQSLPVRSATTGRVKLVLMSYSRWII